jgi:arylsulfatase A
LSDGKWKLVLGNGSGGRAKPRGKPFARPYHLFDMKKDPVETQNLVSEFPEVVEKLTVAFKKLGLRPK